MKGELPLPPNSLTNLSVSYFSICYLCIRGTIVLILSQANPSPFALDLIFSFPVRLHSTPPPTLAPILGLTLFVLFPSTQHISKFRYPPSWARGSLYWFQFPLWFLFIIFVSLVVLSRKHNY